MRYEALRSGFFALTAMLVLGAAVGAATPSAAASRPVDCEITVRGKTYVKKVCQYTPGAGGSFQIDAGDYFAQVDVNGPGQAELHWNGIAGATHAQAYLGAAKRDGACWVGATARICARSLPAGRTQALIAAAPDGGNLSATVAGSPCLGVDGRKLGPQQPVVLQACRLPADNIWVKGGDGTLRLSKHPELCLMAEAPGMSKPLQMIVDTCRPGLPRWTTAATSANEAVIRSSDGYCVTIPKLDDENARFPFEASAAQCARAGGRAVKFIYEKP